VKRVVGEYEERESIVMENLKIIENELVPVYETNTGEKVVYGTELHSVLGVKSRYREWINRRLDDCEAIENEDFEGAEISAPSGQTRKEHIIELDIAKEMAMLERNEKGKQVRRYFIEVEKKYKQVVQYLSEEDKLKLQLFSKDALEVVTAHNKLVEIEVGKATAPPCWKIFQRRNR